MAVNKQSNRQVKKRPKVSIITPLHNKGDYVGETIQSVMAQTMWDWEMIVVENHSTDGGPQTVRSMAKEETRIRLIMAPEEVRGPGAARNLGIKSSQGEWVLFLDADDLILPNHLETLLSVGAKWNTKIAASNWMEFLDKDLKTALDIQKISKKNKAHPMAQYGECVRVDQTTIAHAPWAIHCGLIHSSIFTKEVCWIEELDTMPSEDTGFWFRVLLGQEIAFTNQTTALYRIETVGFRNRHDDLLMWSDALEKIHLNNLQYLQSKNKMPKPEQYESLARTWENLGRKSSQMGLSELSKKCYEKSRYYYKKIAIFSRGLSWGGRLKSIIGPIKLLSKN